MKQRKKRSFGNPLFVAISLLILHIQRRLVFDYLLLPALTSNDAVVTVATSASITSTLDASMPTPNIVVSNDSTVNERIQLLPKATIAYTIAVTACGFPRMMDGASVLKHSIHRSSIRTPSSGSLYDYHMIAMVHPHAEKCSHLLEKIGYEIQIKPSPVRLSEIRNKKYAKIIKGSGCCGEKEFLKLYGYNMTEYPVVVQLDIDTVVTKPLDVLFDVLLLDKSEVTKPVSTEYENILPMMMWNESHTTTTNHPVNAFFTRDYIANLKIQNKSEFIPAQKLHMQGGFLVLRPDPAVFNEYIELIKDGDFIPGRGWGEQGWGGVNVGSGGSDRIQGLVSYYYSGLHPNTSIELNPCNFDYTGAPSRGDSGVCSTGKENQCQDCREKDISDIYTLHFGGCQKPWECPYFGNSMPRQWKIRRKACLMMHREWHRIRNDLEEHLFLAINSTTTNTTISSPQTYHINNATTTIPDTPNSTTTARLLKEKDQPKHDIISDYYGHCIIRTKKVRNRFLPYYKYLRMNFSNI